jgi:undecaprenyl-diphosphatase
MLISLSLIHAFILGLVQGIAEFFPISSSAHLRFARFLMEIPENPDWLYFDLACHAGTWLALFIFLRKQVFETLLSPKKVALFSLSLFPLIPAYFLLKPLRVSLSEPRFTGYFLLVTAALLFLASRKRAISHTHKWENVIFIGVMQALALIPGISRSGSTIAAARFCGWTWIDGAKFSFLLALPTIFGGEILESIKLFHGKMEHVELTPCIVGFLTSFLVGLVAVRYVFWFYEKNNVKFFAFYCLIIGLLMILVFRG